MGVVAEAAPATNGTPAMRAAGNKAHSAALAILPMCVIVRRVGYQVKANIVCWLRQAGECVKKRKGLAVVVALPSCAVCQTL